MAGIYIHIPFCLKKCYYCDFTSYTDTCTDSQDQYIGALLTEIKQRIEILKQKEWSTIFIGGGTPSLLSIDNLSLIKEALNQYIDHSKIKEFTIEVNPKTVDLKKLSDYKELGINRLSIGIQSFEDQELKEIGRIHHSQDALDTIKMAKTVGFTNISVDLIFGLPSQTLPTLRRTLETAINQNVNHISFYGLQVEENTPLHKMVDHNIIQIPPEDDAVDMYLESVKYLKEKGYDQYEISNFARNNLISQHNYNYWLYKDYLGLGVSSHSKIGNTRFANTDSMAEYVDLIKAGDTPTKHQETLTPKEINFEKNMLLIRTKQGIPLSEISKTDYVEELLKNQMANIINQSLVLTPKGLIVSNEIINKILD